MRRQPPLTVDFIRSRLSVDLATGQAIWLDASKHHRPLVGQVAGGPQVGRAGKRYWVIRINGVGYKRAHIVYAVKTGTWPTSTVDHRDGDSLNDAADNLRAATQTQNAWNHKGRKKKTTLPMGVREVGPGRFQARIAVNKKSITLGTFPSPEEAHAIYLAARGQHFGEFA